jgi:Domain of unknown function (DUF4352)
MGNRLHSYAFLIALSALTVVTVAGCGSAGSSTAAGSAASSATTTPNALASEESAAAACNSSGGTWDGMTCSTPTPTPTGPTTLVPGQGESVSVNGSSQTAATITVESATVTTQPAQSYGSGPANGYFVVVHVEATAAQSYTGGFAVNELDFYDLVNSNHYNPGNGNAYEALSDSQQNEDITATLAAGETSSGWIAFDVPSQHGNIVYAPNTNGQPLAEWTY